MNNQINDVDQYIAEFPADIQLILNQIRSIIKKLAPEAEEAIRYKMPTYILKRNLVHFAAFKNHIGIYSVPSGIEQFKNELSLYKIGKGSIQFPLDQPIPYDLISRIVAFRINENLEKAKKAKSLRTCKNGHKYYKTSECPSCPQCTREGRPTNGFLSLLVAPARRALQNAGIQTLQDLSEFTEKEILALHGLGKSSIPILREALEIEGLTFRK